MAKQLLYTDDARKKLLAGAEKLAHAVGITLGPTGRTVSYTHLTLPTIYSV